MFGPDKDKAIPNANKPLICFVKNTINNPNIIVGEYTYCYLKDSNDTFENHVTYQYDFLGDKLIIGKFCQIAEGVEFIMNGANHKTRGISTYPFYVFGNGWEKVTPNPEVLPTKGDTIVGNDVWIGQNATIMPGVHIGDGAIIGTNTVVAKDIPAYHVAVGNPCIIKKKRFDDELIEHLEKIQWWNWDEKKIFDNLETLFGDNLEDIKKIE